jgi:hypothetical protein
VPYRLRIFETLWTVDPAAVRVAARVGASIAVDTGVGDAEQLLYELAGPPAGDLNPARATALLNRVVAYVDRLC